MEVAAREIVARLPTALDDGDRVTAFVNRESAEADVDWGTDVEVVVVPVNARSRFEWVRGEQQLLPGLAARAGCDVVHSLGSTAPVRGRFRRVTTIYDLHYKLVPQAHFGLLGLGMRVLIPAAARRSHRLITASRQTADDLVAHLGVARDKIDVVPLAGGAPASPPSPEPELRARLALGDGAIVLCPGAKRPHKNAVAVLDAVAGMHADIRPIVVVTGYASPYEDELRARADTLGIAGLLRLPEHLPAADVEGLYALCACVVAPSLYEGFGLPVLEAMARGVPVICSDRSSLPEVAGDAALFVDPTDPRAIGAALGRMLADADLRADLAARGRERAAQFSWERTTAGVVAAYRRALALPAR
jgi:glycosyltransferase involved in cell wall biosynthesis